MIDQKFHLIKLAYLIETEWLVSVDLRDPTPVLERKYFPGLNVKEKSTEVTREVVGEMTLAEAQVYAAEDESSEAHRVLNCNQRPNIQ